MALDLIQDVFQPVLARVDERGDSLRKIMRLTNSGIEGWFKVEIVAALGNKVQRIRNAEADLMLEDGTQVEIKAATNFSKYWCVSYPLTRYRQPVLFLAGGASPEKLKRAKDDSFDIVACEGVSDGENEWLLGMVKPRA